MDFQKKGLHAFIDVCLATKDKKDLSDLFDLFFTPEEKSDLALRFLIIEELLKGNKTQREIAKDLNVSIAKITRGSNELKRMNSYILKSLRDKLAL
jgi:TrpR family trp operon transcriptional repressor